MEKTAVVTYYHHSGFTVEVMDTLLELCDEDDLDDLLAFSSLLELAMNEKSIEGLYHYLSNYEG